MDNPKKVLEKGIDDAYRDVSPEAISDGNRYKNMFRENENLTGGMADNFTLDKLLKRYSKQGIDKTELQRQIRKGLETEREHTSNKKIALEIVFDHLYENPKYYDELKNESLIRGKFKTNEKSNIKKQNKPISKIFSVKKIENKEATSTGSSGAFEPMFSSETPKKVETKEATSTSSTGSYETTAAWAKSMKPNDWRGKKKTLYPGGKFVKIKEKCKKFKYCNQGDIGALKLTEDEILQQAISNVSKKMNVSEEIINFLLRENKVK